MESLTTFIAHELLAKIGPTVFVLSNSKDSFLNFPYFAPLVYFINSIYGN